MSDSPNCIAKGIGASPGTARGKFALDAKRAAVLVANKEAYVLVAHELAREDADFAMGAVAIVTTTGGITADAAVMARALGKPCIVSSTLRIIEGRLCDAKDALISEDGVLEIDGLSGEIRTI